MSIKKKVLVSIISILSVLILGGGGFIILFNDNSPYLVEETYTIVVKRGMNNLLYREATMIVQFKTSGITTKQRVRETCENNVCTAQKYNYETNNWETIGTKKTESENSEKENDVI